MNGPAERPSGSKPILKWAGGKTQLLRQLRRAMPTSYDCYMEPAGGPRAY